MAIKKGDRVKFLNDIGGGIVQEIKDSKLAVVLTDDEFEVPVLISELIPVGGSTGYKGGRVREDEEEDEVYDPVPDAVYDPVPDAVSDPDPDAVYDPVPDAVSDPGQDPETGKPARRRPERNLLLGLTDDPSGGNMELWLINDSRLHVFCSVLQKDDLSYTNIKTGHIDPDTRILIRKYTRDQVNSFITIRLQALFFMKGLYDPVPPSQADFAIDPQEIYAEGSMTINDFFDEKALIVHLISDPYEKEVQSMRELEVSRLIDKERKVSPSAIKKSGLRSTDPSVEEVDLHIEELVDDHSGLSGREVLDIQMARFTTTLEGALRSQTKRVVFIHGVGNGKLKFELRKTLDKKYSRLRYQDASFKEYGYGATMVIVRK